MLRIIFVTGHTVVLITKTKFLPTCPKIEAYGNLEQNRVMAQSGTILANGYSDVLSGYQPGSLS
jgi:hypothetical protein